MIAYSGTGFQFCDKCTSNNKPKTIYLPEGAFLDDGTSPDFDVLARECQVCGYRWYEHCADWGF